MSSSFDLTTNIAMEDSRTGLDPYAKQKIKQIMTNKKVGFDEARLLYVKMSFTRHDIRPDGMPQDPKFVSFS